MLVQVQENLMPETERSLQSQLDQFRIEFVNMKDSI